MFKRVLCFLIVLITFMSIPLNAYAEDDEYTHFLQGDDRWGSYNYGGGETIRSAGCAITSFAVLMAYADPSLRDVNTFNPKICAQDYLNFSGSAIYWAPKAGPLSEANVQITSAEDVKNALNDGYYIILWAAVGSSGTHFSPIVGWDDDSNKPIVWDVAGGGLTWDDFTANGVQTGNIHVYSSSVLPSNEAFNGESYSTDGSQSQEEIDAYQSVIEEWNLKGMPSKSDIAVDMADVVLPDQSELSFSDRLVIGNIKENIDASKMSTYRIIKIIFVVIGLILIVYTILLMIGYVFDKSNSFLEVSIVSFLTLGRVKILNDNDAIAEEEDKKGYIKPNAFFVRLVILFIAGCLLISSIIPALVMKIVYSIV